MNDEWLCDAYVEHRVKEMYKAYLSILEQGLRDELPFYKENITNVLSDLLKTKPEQEQVIIR